MPSPVVIPSTGGSTTPHSDSVVPLIIWLGKGMSWFAAASGKRGRSPVLPSSWEKVNGSVKSMALRGGASGASLHLGIDAQRGRCGPCVTSNHISNAAVVSNLLAQLPEGEPLLSFTGDTAYDAEPMHASMMKRHAMPIIRGDLRHSWVDIKMH